MQSGNRLWSCYFYGKLPLKYSFNAKSVQLSGIVFSGQYNKIFLGFQPTRVFVYSGPDIIANTAKNKKMTPPIRVTLIEDEKLGLGNDVRILTKT